MVFEIILAFINYFGSGQLASRKQTNKQTDQLKRINKPKPNKKKFKETKPKENK